MGKILLAGVIGGIGGMIIGNWENISEHLTFKKIGLIILWFGGLAVFIGLILIFGNMLLANSNW